MIRVINEKENMILPGVKGLMSIKKGVPFDANIQQYQLLSRLYKNMHRVKIIDLPKITEPVEINQETTNVRRKKKLTNTTK